MENFDGFNYPSIETLRKYPASYKTKIGCRKWILDDVLYEKSSFLGAFIYIIVSLEDSNGKYSQSKYVWWAFKDIKIYVKNIIQNLHEKWW